MPSFQDYVKFVQEHIPGFKVCYKDESLSSKLIAVLVWVFNRHYMTRFTTTRYPKVYFPSRKYIQDNPTLASKILMHEFVHLWDRKEQGVCFTLDYIFPQSLAIPSFLGATLWVIIVPGSFWLQWLVPIVGWVLTVIFLLPFSSRGRAMAELRGYSMNLAVNYWKYGSIRPSTIDWIVDEFTGWNYYRMWPNENEIRIWLSGSMQMIQNDLLDASSIGSQSGKPYRLVRDRFYV